MVLTAGSLVRGRRLLVMAAALAAIATLGACSLPPSTPIPSGDPATTPGRSASFAASPSETPNPGSGSPYSRVELPDDRTFTLLLDDQLGQEFRLHRYSAWGSRVVFDSNHQEFSTSVYLADLATGELLAFASTRQPGWRMWEPDISEDWVVWTEYRYDRPASFTGKLAFRLMARSLTDGSRVEVAAGVHTRLEGGQAIPPVIRVDGDHVAYAVEHARPGHPLGWRVTLRSLATGEIERTLDTDLDLYKLDVSDGNIVYSEGQADLEISYKYGLRLMLSTPDRPRPVEIARDAYDVAISGDRFSWMSDPEAGAERSPMPIRPVIMTATVTDHTPRQVSVTTSAPEPPPPGWGPPRFGAMFPAVGDGLVAWQDRQSDGRTWDGQLVRLALWDSRSGVAHQLEPAPDPLFVKLEGGWLTWYTDISPDGTTVTHVFHGVPIDDVPELASP